MDLPGRSRPRLLEMTAISLTSIPSRTWRTVRRLISYARSDEDVRAVYGDHPNGGRADPSNTSGSMAANLSGGWGG